MTAARNIQSGLLSLHLADDEKNTLQNAYDWVGKKLGVDPAMHYPGLFLPAVVMQVETLVPGTNWSSIPKDAQAASFIAHSGLLNRDFPNGDLLGHFNPKAIRAVRDAQAVMAADKPADKASEDARLVVLATGAAEMEMVIDQFTGKPLDTPAVIAGYLPSLMSGMDDAPPSTGVALWTRRESLGYIYDHYAARHAAATGTTKVKNLERRFSDKLRTVHLMKNMSIRTSGAC